ncbi:sulfatase-like hydrolase/transferase [Paraurantiacibacter namhicola]|uniref:Sulfatase n=1 Tax=Paraurantiacibacter namhicola TaxID=645517 RepID=A0A1C7DA01_9SPHN|nr:sulfatase-like hydrolase/transferase [Paraurantiacibacter namhicola]ANU08310.1 Sulfatase [Paraurantiacibacter namhicola]
MRIVFKLLLLCASLAIGYAQVADRLASFAGEGTDWVGLGLYGAVAGLCVASLLIAAFLQRAWVRWSYAVLFAFGSLLVGGYQLVVAEHMSYEAFLNMSQAGGSFHEAWAQHGSVMLLGFAEAALLLLGVGLGHGLQSRWLGWRAAWLPLVITALVIAMMFQRGGEGGRGLPPSHIGLAYAAFHAGETLLSPVAERQDVAIQSGKPLAAQDIVLVVDESIAGNYLDINHSGGARSGLLGVEGAHNFGLAAAISHCSASANQTLRYGGTRDDYRRINAEMPSIWSYARAAGFETVYIDAQREGGAYQNLMDEAEMAAVDRWIQYDGVPVLERDHRAARDIAAYSRDGKRQFIFVNKVGAHFPIHDKFPDEFARHQPMLPRGSYRDIVDTGERTGFGGQAQDWVRYRNSYRNTLDWNVGGFFDLLLAQADRQAMTLIYTADHGQDLHEDGGPSRDTHCSPEPEQAEGVVPLVVLDAPEGGAFDWAAAAARKAPTSHYRIFPTLLQLMGYPETAVTGAYGADLLSSERDPFTFNTRFNARLGREPRWLQVDPDTLPTPPASDTRQD